VGKGLSESLLSPLLTLMLMSLVLLHRCSTSEKRRWSFDGLPPEYSFCLFSKRLILSCTLSVRPDGAITGFDDSVFFLVGVSLVWSFEFTLVLLRRNETKLEIGLGLGGSMGWA